jgi:hypothetical protein
MSISIKLAGSVLVLAGTQDSIQIFGQNQSDGHDIDITLPSRLCSALVNPILIGSVLSASPQPKPAEGTPIGMGHISVLQWQVGLSNINQEPVLILTIPGGTQIVFQFPSQAAQECGKALAEAS